MDLVPSGVVVHPRHITFDKGAVIRIGVGLQVVVVTLHVDAAQTVGGGAAGGIAVAVLVKTGPGDGDVSVVIHLRVAPDLDTPLVLGVLGGVVLAAVDQDLFVLGTGHDTVDPVGVRRNTNRRGVGTETGHLIGGGISPADHTGDLPID